MLVLVEVLFEVLLHILKDEVKFLLTWLVDNFFKSDDVRVWLKLLQNGNLPHRSGGDPFVFVLELYLL